MNIMTIDGIILMMFGVLSLIYGGITFTSKKECYMYGIISTE